MRAAWHIAALELRRRLRDRSLLIQGVLGPIVLAAIIGFAFGGGSGAAVNVDLGVVDADRSDISAGLLDGLRAAADEDEGPPVELVAVDDEATARAAVDAGDMDAALVIPAGFADSLAGDEPLPIGVLATGSRRFSGDIAVSVAERLSSAVDAQRTAMAAAAASGEQLPEFVPTATSVAEEPVGGEFDAVAYFAPSMAILFLFFTVGAGARSLLRERADGTLARVRAAPVTDRSILVGKTLAVLAAGTVSLAVVWGVTEALFGARWGAPAGVALVLAGVVVAVSGIAAVVAGTATTEAQADSTTSIIAFVLALIGGNFISPGALPDLFQRLSLATPNGWALRALVELSAGDAAAADVLPAVAVLLAMGLVTGAIGMLLLSRSVLSEGAAS